MGDSKVLEAMYSKMITKVCVFADNQSTTLTHRFRNERETDIVSSSFYRRKKGLAGTYDGKGALVWQRPRASGGERSVTPDIRLMLT